jgi:hypothetical protein
MKAIFNKLKNRWNKASNQKSEISLNLELITTKDNPSNIFRSTHLQLNDIDSTDEILIDWLSLEGTEAMIYFKRTPHQSNPSDQERK